MAERVTLQDIADALGLSRNTVSKAVNNTGILADATREKVLRKAVEMGYKQFSYMSVADLDRLEPDPPSVGTMGEIAVFTTGFVGKSYFLATVLDRLQRSFSQWGYRFTVHRIRGDEAEALALPNSFQIGNTSGIVCLEMLDGRYCSMLCGLDIPVLFVDSPVLALNGPLKADILCMENQSAVCSFVREMAARGKRRIGFIGEYMHCQSFFERYMGYRNIMALMNLPVQEKFCITGDGRDTEGRVVEGQVVEGGGQTIKGQAVDGYREYLTGCLGKMDELPEVFLCANDFVAMDVLYAFKKLGIGVPQDVWLCGFDDSRESQVISPSLTTIHIHSHIIGDTAAYLLLSRIKNPSLNYRTIHTQTSLVYRESTGD